MKQILNLTLTSLKTIPDEADNTAIIATWEAADIAITRKLSKSTASGLYLGDTMTIVLPSVPEVFPLSVDN